MFQQVLGDALVFIYYQRSTSALPMVDFYLGWTLTEELSPYVFFDRLVDIRRDLKVIFNKLVPINIARLLLGTQNELNDLLLILNLGLWLLFLVLLQGEVSFQIYNNRLSFLYQLTCLLGSSLREVLLLLDLLNRSFEQIFWSGFYL